VKLVYYNVRPNFGDELSPVLFNAILPPGFIDSDEEDLLLGVGSILWDNLPGRPVKHVLGSGYGGYTSAPDVHDGRWNIVFVRGPHTAARLGLPTEKAICDTAVLLRLTELPEPASRVGVAFMPHCASRDRGYWAEACKLAGITFVDPRGDFVDITRKIRGAEALIAEAMHGAIVADAIRTPWVAAKPLHRVNRMKWNDWADSLAIDLRWAQLLPSSVMEAYHASFPSAEPWRAKKTRESLAYRPANQLLVHLAAHRLQQIARREPQLSSDEQLDSAIDRAATATDLFLKSRGTTGVRTGAPLIV
jgi:succinoglycan biosynthesis protein ExoV